MHWSKEASSYRCLTPYWFRATGGIFYDWIIGTMVEAIVRRWCCPIGGNNFVSRRYIVTTIRQHCNLHARTVLSITTKMSLPIPGITVYFISSDGTLQTQ